MSRSAKKRLNGWVFILILTALSFGAREVQAATGLTIQPIKVSQTLDPGTTFTGFINLSNVSDDEVLVQVKAEDFLPSAGTNTFNFIGRAPGVTSVRDWINIDSPNEFLFEKGKNQSIRYTITVPKDAEPGGHFGVIFFKAIEKEDAEEQLKIGTQVGMLVLVTVSGDFERSGKILDVKAPKFVTNTPITLVMNFENTGTVHFEPKGKISIKNMFGKEVGVVPIEGHVILPTGVKEMGFVWQSHGILLGKYKAEFSIEGEDGKSLDTREVEFYAVPVWYGLGFLVSFFFIWRIVVFLRTRVSINIKPKK